MLHYYASMHDWGQQESCTERRGEEPIEERWGEKYRSDVKILQEQWATIPADCDDNGNGHDLCALGSRAEDDEASVRSGGCRRISSSESVCEEGCRPTAASEKSVQVARGRGESIDEGFSNHFATLALYGAGEKHTEGGVYRHSSECLAGYGRCERNERRHFS